MEQGQQTFSGFNTLILRTMLVSDREFVKWFQWF